MPDFFPSYFMIILLRSRWTEMFIRCNIKKCNFIIEVNVNVCIGRTMWGNFYSSKIIWSAIEALPFTRLFFRCVHSYRIPRYDPNTNSLIDSPFQPKNIPISAALISSLYCIIIIICIETWQSNVLLKYLEFYWLTSK